MGQTRIKRLTHVTTLHTRLSSEGAIQPSPLFWRLSNLGCLYRVWRCLLERLTPRRLSRLRLTCCPLWVSSAAKTTSPDASLTRASPVTFEPGSILRRSGSHTGCSTTRLRMMVNGYLLNTAALPAVSNIRALAGCVGANGCLLVSRTNTLRKMFSPIVFSHALLAQVMVALTRLWSGLTFTTLS